jgi:acyl-CoA synthetase (AMP-forming)/AMP-acid ligase II
MSKPEEANRLAVRLLARMSTVSLLGALEATCARRADRDALSGETGRLSYGQLWDDVCALGRAYRRLGVQPGARIVCRLANRPEYLVALGGAWACGAVHVGVDPELTAREVERVVHLTGAEVLVCDVAPSARPSAVRATVVCDGSAQGGGYTFAQMLAIGRAPDSHGAPAARPDDPAVIFISSGTTGAPKATVGFHANLGMRWQRLAEWLRFGAGDVHLAPLPLTHGFGLMMTVAALLGGGRVVLQRTFRATDALDAIAGERVTVFNGTPTHFRLLLRELERAPRDVRSLRLSAGTAAAFPPALVQRIWDQLGVELVVMYGSSEGVGVATSERSDILLGSVGKPQPGAARIIGPQGESLPPGAVGEIAFSRRVYPVRYYGSESAQDGRGDESWFHSGDLGMLDEEGRLFVFGRTTRLIDRGGMKVDPVEVERALLGLPEIADAAVIALANPMLGEIICACIVPAASALPTLDALRWTLGAELASFKLPDELCILEQIPRTSLGKLRMDALTTLVAARRPPHDAPA